jgi:RNA polymerase sigma-70 factor (ECF subfamily)
VIDVREAITRAHDEEWARLVASLTWRFGDLDIAEEAAAEAFATAVGRWPVDGVPANPGAWLTTTASRKAIDRIRRESKRGDKQREAQMLNDDDPPEPLGAIEDERLRLIFTCCHPALATEARVALTLRMVGGLTVPEIARAFLVQETTMGQRITRAKAKIKAARIPYRVPAAEDLPARVSAVLAVLFLVFNEGYLATGPDTDPLRHDLTGEAIRLTRLLRALMPQDGEVAGLLALMVLTEARRNARISASGELVPLAEQDRGAWDAALVAEGHRLVRERLAAGAAPGRYQILAAINAVHTSARDVQRHRLVAGRRALRPARPPRPLADHRAQPGRRGRRARRPKGGTGGRRPSRGQVGRLSRLPRDPRRPAAPAGLQSEVTRGVRQSDRAGGQHRRDRLPDTTPQPARLRIHMFSACEISQDPAPSDSLTTVRGARRSGARPFHAAERSAGRRGGQLGEHRGLPLERLLVAVEGIAVGQLAGVEVADMRPVGSCQISIRSGSSMPTCGSACIRGCRPACLPKISRTLASNSTSPCGRRSHGRCAANTCRPCASSASSRRASTWSASPVVVSSTMCV